MRLWKLTRELVYETYEVSVPLFKTMIPVIIIVKILEELGGIYYLSMLLAPLMQLVGLPDSMGIVWATTILTNLYAGMLVFANIAANETLTVAQVTVLSGLLLIAHSLPLEGSIARKTGVHWWFSLAVRMGGGLLFGWLLHITYQTGGWMQEPSQLAWQPEIVTDQSLMQWTWVQIQSLFVIFVIIFVLLIVLRFFRWVGIEKLIGILLTPILRLLGMSPRVINFSMVGITLGLALGGGLLIKEAKQGHLSTRDILLGVTLLSFMHSMIEDTILVLLLGADINGVLYGRIIFSLVFVGLFALCLRWFEQRHFYTPINA